MDAYNLTDAATRLDELVERVEAGENIDLVREGRVVARLTPAIASSAARRSIDVQALRKVAATLPLDPVDSVAEMRRDARY